MPAHQKKLFLSCLTCFIVHVVKSQIESDCIGQELRDALMKLSRDVAEISSSKRQTDVIPSEGSNALEILLEILIDDINSFDSRNMDFRLDIFIKHAWKVPKDTCQSYKQMLHKMHRNLTEDRPLFLSPVYFYLFWLPDTYIINAKKVESPSKVTPTRVLTLHTLGDICKLEYTVRLAVMVACQMNFAYYPADIQHCPLNMRSYAYPHTMFYYNWENKTSAVPLNEDVVMLQHTVRLSKGVRQINMLERTYSVIYVNFTFERKVTHFLPNVYVPSTLIIIISCFSFWLGTDVISGRITLCIACILSLVIQMRALQNMLPPVSYMNAIDAWMISCLMFAFASLLELTIVWFIDKTHKENITKLEQEIEQEEIDQNHPLPYYSHLNIEKGRRPLDTPCCTCMEGKDWKHRGIVTATPHKQKWIEDEDEEESCQLGCCCSLTSLDKVSRILFPLLFAIFNAAYWPLLLSRKSQNFPGD